MGRHQPPHKIQTVLELRPARLSHLPDPARQHRWYHPPHEFADRLLAPSTTPRAAVMLWNGLAPISIQQPVHNYSLFRCILWKRRYVKHLYTFVPRSPAFLIPSRRGDCHTSPGGWPHCAQGLGATRRPGRSIGAHSKNEIATRRPGSSHTAPRGQPYSAQGVATQRLNPSILTVSTPNN